MAMIKVEQLAHAFGAEQVLNDINLRVKKGEIFGLLGPSGAGKTTLVKLIVGILEADRGSIHVGEEKVPSFNVMKSMGYMAQADALYEELSAQENLHFFATLYGMKKEARKKAIASVLEVVDLTDHLHKLVRHFSGGMKKRLSLAISLLHHPQILILDEPTVGIDPVLRHANWQELIKLKEGGMTIVLTTHVMDEAEKCDRLAMLRDGHIIACDTPDNLKKSQGVASLEEAFLAFGGVAR